jgi:D-alanyl-D-alanine carboxypeptidase/D-alanyl-D-alanine carboxypeptidase (penicillin-binding protein 5/6)
MNEKAREIGMKNTHFANPSGLDDEEHYSTARDMALLARACLEYEVLARIAASKSATLEGRLLTNHNKLLWRYDGCVGLKTGYPKKSGRTLVSAAKRDGMTLICVTLNAPDDWRDHETLFDYGFEKYELRCLVQKGEILCRLPVTGSLLPMCEIRARNELWAAVEKGSRTSFGTELNCGTVAAPARAGTDIGWMFVSLDGQEIGSCRMELNADIPENTAPPKFDLMRFFGR